MKATLIWLLALTCASMTSGSILGTKSRDNASFELLILHNNDMHARFEQTSQLSSTCSESDEKSNKCYGGFARVANKVREARKAGENPDNPAVLYLNAGDTYTGSVWFSVFHWKIAAAFINALQPDAVSLGNHEFDDGVSGLTPFIHNLTCPVLCANIDVRGEADLQEETKFNLKKSIVLDVRGRRIGIIGYLTPDTKHLVSPNRVEYEDEVPAIQREVDALSAQGINIIIALGHSGFDSDLRIAREVNGVDVVIGGHTNTFLWNGAQPDAEKVQGIYPEVVVQKSGRKVPVVQAYAYTKYLGNLHLNFDTLGELVDFKGQPMLLDGSVPQEKDILDLLDEFRPAIANMSREIVGNTKVILNGTNSACRLEECNLGNLICDAIVYSRASRVNFENAWTDAPITVQQGGLIRSSIDARSLGGNITRSDVMTVLPFTNTLLIVSISGKVLLDVLERSVSNYSPITMDGAFLQVSGINVVYDLAKDPGSRVQSVLVRCAECKVPEYFPLAKNATYKIILNKFMLEGGDGYSMFKDGVKSSEELDITSDESLIEYLRKFSPVYPGIEGRITLLHASVGAASYILLNPMLLFVCLIFKQIFC